jgi:biotin transport system substrate-specific component
MFQVLRTQVEESRKTDTLLSYVPVLVGSVFLALMAQVAVVLPFSPVAVSMQNVAVLILAASLGSRKAAMSVILYLVEGTCGLPVFAAGMVDPLWFLGAKAGYLCGFVLVAYVAGKLFERKTTQSFLSLFSTCLLGLGIILALGASWLGVLIGPQAAVTMGILPFILVDVLKAVALASSLKGLSLIKK